jgi:transcriptional regulator with XRE-family HTH domain
MTPKTKPLESFFAARLATLREARGLTQQQLADAAGLHRTQINRLEMGHWQPRLPTLRKLAAALGVGIEQLA